MSRPAAFLALGFVGSSLCLAGCAKDPVVCTPETAGLGDQARLVRQALPGLDSKPDCVAHVDLVRTQVGDRYVVEEMRRHGYNLGGEQSGHVIFLEHNHTGDGLLTALQVLAILRRKELPLSELASGIERFPQVLVNVTVAEKRPLESLPEFTRQLREVEAALGTRGRVLIRYSGTEAKARVMVEGEDEKHVHQIANDLADGLRRALAGGRA